MVSGVAEGNVLPGRGARAWGMGGRGAGEAAVVDMSHGAEGYFSDVGELCQRSE
jgi:hypothetical protein